LFVIHLKIFQSSSILSILVNRREMGRMGVARLAAALRANIFESVTAAIFAKP
jgi:hypothetical protein